MQPNEAAWNDTLHARYCRRRSRQFCAFASGSGFRYRLYQPFCPGRYPAPGLSDQLAFGEPEDRRTYGVVLLEMV
jgi:hypothetical protein